MKVAGPPGSRSRSEHLIYAVDSHGVEHFFDLLRSAVLLGRESGNDVRVIYLPFYPWRKRRGAASPTDGLYDRFRRGQPVSIEHAGRRVRFEHAAVSPMLRLRTLLHALGGATRIWASAYRRLRFDRLRFLAATHRGTTIGDYVASHHLRDSADAFELAPSPNLFRLLWGACWLIEVAATVAARTAAGAYVISPELGYVQNVPRRYLHGLGAMGLDCWQLSAPLAVVLPGEEYDGRIQAWTAPDASSGVDDAAAARRADVYLSTRLRHASSLLPYLTTGENDNDAPVLLDAQGQAVRPNGEALHVVLFLHLFADTQYHYGRDGFEGLAEWSLHTVDSCLANSNVGRVLIKPHPAPDYVAYPGDRLAFERMVARYRGDPRVTVLHPRASLRRIAELGRVIGITHHGSVAEELVHLGKPVIASTFGPWGTRYRFARVWSTREEYDALLSTLSAKTWSPPSAEEQRELRRYILDHRLNEVSDRDREPLSLVARFLGVDVPETGILVSSSPETKGRLRRRLEEVREGEPLLEFLLQAYESLGPVAYVDPAITHRAAAISRGSGDPSTGQNPCP